MCHVEDGPALSSHVARRLACDADVVGVVIDTDGDPACVSHHQRIATRRLRDALRARDGRCQFANCDHRARLQAHHIVHWADGGRTILVNLVLLCAKHHRAVHEGGFTLERAADHRIVVRRPDGQLLTHHHCQADPAVTIETQHRTYGYDIDANTNECGWEGRTPNISDIISHFDTKCRINQHCEGCGEPWFVARQDAGRRPTWLWDEDEDAASGEAGRHNHTNVG